MGKRLLADETIIAQLDPDASSGSAVNHGFQGKNQNITSGQNTGKTKKRKPGVGDDINCTTRKADQEFPPKGGSEVNRKKRGSPVGCKTKAKPSPSGLDLPESSGSAPNHGFQAKHQNITSGQNSLNTMKRKRGGGDDVNCSTGKADEEFQPDCGSEVNRKNRGTPVGWKTKANASPTGIREMSSIMKNHVVEVASGYDVIKALGMFARTYEQGVFVMSGSGTVNNVMLLEPAIPEGIVAHAGLFQIVSLTGAFRRGCENEGATGLRVHLVSAQGRTVGGTAIGSMIAQSRVVLVLGTAVNIPLERLKVQRFQLPGVMQPQPPTAVQECFPRSHGIQTADKHWRPSKDVENLKSKNSITRFDVFSF